MKGKTTLGGHGIFDKMDVNSIAGVRVFYVGQGDAIGILNEDKEVVLYIDYGGLLDHPDKNNQYKNTFHRLKPVYNKN